MTDKLRQLAKGQECKVRIPGVCNHNPETTVLAHMGGAGMALKDRDIFGAHACSSCHDVIDGRSNEVDDDFAVQVFFLAAIIETQHWLYDNGYITWEGDEIQRKDPRATERLITWVKRLSGRMV